MSDQSRLQPSPRLPAGELNGHASISISIASSISITCSLSFSLSFSITCSLSGRRRREGLYYGRGKVVTVESVLAVYEALGPMLFGKNQVVNVCSFKIVVQTSFELGGPLVQPVYNLPRLLRRFQRLSKPLIVLGTAGSPPPPSGLSDLLDSTKSIIQVNSTDEAVEALQDEGLTPSRPQGSRPQGSRPQGLTPTEMDEPATSTTGGSCKTCETLQAENASLKAQLSYLEEKGECEWWRNGPHPG